jgi:hypothetical protein
VRRVRFTSVRGHRVRLLIAIYGSAIVFGLQWPYVWR